MRTAAVASICLLFFAAGCASPGMKGEGKMEYKTLEAGAKAPDFWLKNQDQQRVSLSTFEGKKNVILVFFPLAFTPV